MRKTVKHPATVLKQHFPERNSGVASCSVFGHTLHHILYFNPATKSSTKRLSRFQNKTKTNSAAGWASNERTFD